MPKICLDAGHFANCNWNQNVTPIYWESRMAWKLHLMLKEELEKYGFSVIVTRTDEEKDLALMARGQKAQGCDLFLSLHSNACDTESVDRAVVIYPVSEAKKDLATALSQTVTQVMQLKDAPQIYYKWNSAHNADYYGVIRGSVSVGVPGLIIEHSFHTHNASANWLNVDSNLRKLAVAEAKTLADHFGLQLPQQGMSEDEIKEFISSQVTAQVTQAKKELDKKLSQISKKLSEAYNEALTGALASVSDTADQKITERVGPEIGHLKDIPSKRVQEEFKSLLDAEYIDGGTPKEQDATDIHLPWSVVRALVVAKRYMDGRLAEFLIEDADRTDEAYEGRDMAAEVSGHYEDGMDFDCGDACKIPLFDGESDGESE